MDTKYTSGTKKRLVSSLLPLILGAFLASCQSMNTAHNQNLPLLEAQLSLAERLIDDGRAHEALDMLRTLIASQGEHPEILNFSGLAHLSLGNFEAALSWFQKAHKLSDNDSIKLNESSTLLALYRSQEALTLLQELLSSSYAYRERIFHNMGLAYEQKELWDEALNCYQKALRENPIYPMSQFRLALIFKKKNKKQLALNAMKKTIKYCPLCWEPRKTLSDWYREEGDPEKAKIILKNFLSYKELSKKDRSLALKAVHAF
jgi:tetratricopeptide (TPR) repeat protein